jgi:D-glycero-D-manno-heptose 1,7-bisphosphate phosphatase
MTERYVVLDRDGVINIDSDAFIKSPDEWIPIPGSLEAIALLNQHGYQIAVITNQSGIARGMFDLAALTAIHDKMRKMAAAVGGEIAKIYFCPHGPDDDCSCRKPKPGMFDTFARETKISLHDVYAVGDSLRDIEAGLAAGAKPILVKTGKGLKTLADSPQFHFPTFDDLYDAAKFIITAN